MALRPCLTMQGSAPGPGATIGPTRAAWVSRCSTHTRYCVRAWSGLWPALFAHSASCRAGAPAPALGRFGAARPPPLRGAVPALCALGPFGPPRPRPPGLPPRLPRSGSGAGPLPRFRPRSLPPLPGPCPRCAAGSLFGRPCFVSGAALGLRVGPPGPPRPVRCAASGAAGSRPGGLRGPSGRLSGAVGPRGVGCAPAPARACCAPLRRRFGCRWVLPCAPPPRRPRWGLRGARCPFGWASPPAARVALIAPLLRPPRRAARAPVRRFRAVDSPEIVNRGLHTSCKRPAFFAIRA